MGKPGKVKVRIQTLQGVILRHIEAGTGYEEILRIGHQLAKERGEVLRAYDRMTKIATLHPDA